MDRFSFSQLKSEIAARSHYFVAWVISLITTPITAICFLRAADNPINALIVIILIPLLVQILIGGAMVKRFRYVYQFDVAAIIMLPFLMNSLGSFLGFWLSYELFCGGFHYWMAILAGITFIFAPLFANFFASGGDRGFGLKPKLFYLIGLIQMSLGALIMMLIFNHF